MQKELAIITPVVGNPSEQFIKRHLELINPGHTIVFTEKVVASDSSWKTNVPVYDLWNGDYIDYLDKIKFKITSSLGNSAQTYSIRQLQYLLNKFRPSVILSEYLDKSLDVLKIARELGIPIYLHGHGYDASERLNSPEWVQRYSELNTADGIIVPSQAMKKRLVSIGIMESNINVVPYGVECPDVFIDRKIGNPVRVLAAGRLTAKKGPIYTLAAFQKLLTDEPNLILEYVGGGELTPAVIAYRAICKLEKNVNLYGAQPHAIIDKLMGECEIFVQHSITDPVSGDQEGLPVAILEAMAAGLPVVSTFHSGIPEAVSHGVSGFLVEEGDWEGFSHYILELVRNPLLRREMGIAGQKHIRENSSVDVMVAKLRQNMGLGQI